jgi:transposase
MLTWRESLEAQALRDRGWTITAIARHLDRDPKTIRAYLSGERTPGEWRRSAPDPFAPYVAYVTQRLNDDKHLWATTLYDEVVALGYAGSYPSFTRALRTRGLRPACEECAAATGRGRAIIAHPPAEETQWDWVELPDPPASWGLPGAAHLLVGALAHSSRWRGVLAESEDQPHLIEALDQVVRRLGGCTLAWRFDRMATVCHPGTGEVTASFAQVAKFYRVAVRICPPRRGRRKGVAEKSNHAAAQRWWRTLPDDVTPAQAQAGLDALCARVGDTRVRRVDGTRTTVGQLADAEPLQPAPDQPYPAVLETTPTVTDQALVPFRGNFYSVPPGLAGRVMTVRMRLGDRYLQILSPTRGDPGPAPPPPGRRWRGGARRRARGRVGEGGARRRQRHRRPVQTQDPPAAERGCAGRGGGLAWRAGRLARRPGGGRFRCLCRRARSPARPPPRPGRC